jgi:hypothetical protein
MIQICPQIKVDGNSQSIALRYVEVCFRSDLHYRVQLTLHIKRRVDLPNVSLKLKNIKYFINPTCESLLMCHANTAEKKFDNFTHGQQKIKLADYAHGTPKYLQETMSHCQVLYRRSHTDNPEIKPRLRQ